MTIPKLLARADINGQSVSFFSPPHAEPDFPWVDIEELAGAFLDAEGAKRMVQHVHNFDRDHRPVATAQNGDRIATIAPHAIAQGLCQAIDQWSGFVANDDEDNGPAFWAYCAKAGVIAADHWPMDFADLIHAFKNPGGPFMREGDAA